MKIFFANNTQSGHEGSKAAMKSLLYRLRKHEIVGFHYVGKQEINQQLFDDAEVLVVNGEGTIHLDSSRGDYLMILLEQAQNKGKKTYLINSVFQHIAPYCARILKKLDFLSVREVFSQDSAKKCGGNPKILLDNCKDPIVWKSGKQKQDFKGGIVKGQTFWGEIPLDYPEITMKSYSFGDIVETLKTASVYITGQHHGVYAAGIAGIPFIPIKSNSHKIEGLIKTFGFSIKVYDREDIEGILKEIPHTIANKNIYNDFHKLLMEADFFKGNEIN